MSRFRSHIAVFLILCPLAHAEDLTGKVVITKKLTRRNVTAPVSMYQRGPVVSLGKDSEADPLAWERERAVIYIEGTGPAGASVRPSMQQLDRRFMPDLVVVPAGSTVSFPNMDPIFHNVFSLSKPKSFDLGNYSKGDSRDVTFPKPGIVYVNCRLHPNMAGTVVVTPNQWFARADKAGQFSIHDLPPGNYTVVAWHKAAGFFSKQVQVAAGSGASISFLIPINEDPEAVRDMQMPLGKSEAHR